MASSIIRKLKASVIFVFVTCVVSAYAGQSPVVRVAIIEDAKDVTLRINGSYRMRSASGGEVLRKGNNLSASVGVDKGGIVVGGKDYREGRLFFENTSSGLIEVNEQVFKGGVQFIKNTGSRLTVVNYIDIEDYIKGVLLYESSYYWPMEALKAQAVACRTYAFYQAQENKLKNYDLKRCVASQVYGGSSAERWRLNKAVDATKGEALLYQGKVFPAYFHSTCAGHTEDASELWDIDIASLKGGICRFCRQSPHFSWSASVSFKEIRNRLLKAGYKPGRIKNIESLGRNKSGRIKALNIVSDKEKFQISAKDFRGIIGPDVVRSVNFTVDNTAEAVFLKGAGWGHGVGLCQWGAYFMAKEGSSFKDILKHYYPHSEVKKVN